MDTNLMHNQPTNNHVMSAVARALPTLALFALTFVAIASIPALAGPEIPGAPQKKPVAITGATIHRVAQPPITDATLVFDNGKITQVGRDVEIPEDAKIVNAAGKHVYPGLINMDGSLGLIEVNAVRATDDTGEVGQLNMNVRADVAVNPDSQLIPVTRSGGVLMNLTAPKRGLITGMSALLQLDGWTTEDLAFHTPAGMHVRWPGLNEAEHHEEEKEVADRVKQRDERLRRIEEVFDAALAYQKSRAHNPDQPVDLRWEAMLPVLDGDVPIIAAADRATQIQSAVAFANRRKLQLIIYGGHDAEQCAELLKAQNVPVILTGVYRLPMRRNEAYDSAFTLPARLHKAGVRFCISGAGRFDAANIRNLPHHAAMAIAFGLPEADAIRAITHWPAEILGVADRVGTLEKGKLATLIIADKNIFDSATNVTHAWVQGREVDLANRHKRLYRKYLERQKQNR